MNIIALLSISLNIGLFALVIYLFRVIARRTTEARYVADLWDKQRISLNKLEREVDVLKRRASLTVMDE